jgi:hypothetical protein
MTLDGKHSFGSIGETRVTFVEKNVEENRKNFLVQILEHNGYETIIELEKKKAEEDPQLYTVAVTDMVFNPTIAIFERKLKTLDDHIITQDYWFERTKETKPQYWKNS